MCRPVPPYHASSPLPLQHPGQRSVNWRPVIPGESRDIAVNERTGNRLDRRVRLSGWSSSFLHCCCCRTDSEAHSSFRPVGTGGSLPGTMGNEKNDTPARTWCGENPRILSSCFIELQNSSLIIDNVLKWHGGSDRTRLFCHILFWFFVSSSLLVLFFIFSSLLVCLSLPVLLSSLYIYIIFHPITFTVSFIFSFCLIYLYISFPFHSMFLCFLHRTFLWFLIHALFILSFPSFFRLSILPVLNEYSHQSLIIS